MYRMLRLNILLVALLCAQAAFALCGDEFWNAQPRIEVQTKNGELPTATVVPSPNGKVGCTIKDNDYVLGRIRIFSMDSLFFDSGEEGMKIRVRGNTSGSSSRPPYKIKLSEKADLLNLGYRDKEWNLLTTSSGVANFAVGKIVGDVVGMEWQPNYMYAPLFFNGEYYGLYLLVESVKRDKNRVNVSKNGFIIENDYYYWNEEVFFKTPNIHPRFGYTFKYPDEDDINAEFLEKVKDVVMRYEGLLFNQYPLHTAVDVESLASWVLAHDLLGTGDALGANMYAYIKDIDGNGDDRLLKFGPLWDFDSIFSEDEWCSFRRRKVWYIDRIFQNREFREAYKKKWEEVRETLYDEISSRLDEVYAANEYLDEALRCTDPSAPSFSDEITSAKRWFRKKIDFIDREIDNVRFVEFVEYYTLSGEKMRLNWDLDSGFYVRVFYDNKGGTEARLMFVKRK